MGIKKKYTAAGADRSAGAESDEVMKCHSHAIECMACWGRCHHSILLNCSSNGIFSHIHRVLRESVAGDH
jgi:hypothetical protein